MAKIDALFMAETPEKPYPLGPHLYSPFKGVSPPGVTDIQYVLIAYNNV